MLLTLELSPDLEQALEAAVQVAGRAPADYAAPVLTVPLTPVMALMQRAGFGTSAFGPKMLLLLDGSIPKAQVPRPKTDVPKAFLAHKFYTLLE